MFNLAIWKKTFKSAYNIKEWNIINSSLSFFSMTAGVFTTISLPSLLILITSVLADNTVPISTLYLLAASYGGIWILQNTLPKLTERFLNSPAESFTRELENELIKKYYELPPDLYVSNPTSDEVNFYFNFYLKVTRGFYKSFFSKVVPSIFETTASLSLISYYFPYQGITLLIAGGVQSLIAIFSLPSINKIRDAHDKGISAGFTELLALLEKSTEVHYWDTVDYETKQFDNVLKNYRTKYLDYYTNHDNLTLVQNFITGLGITGVVFLTTRDFRQSKIPIRDVIWMLTYLLQYSSVINKFFDSVYEFYNSYEVLEDFEKYLKKPTVKDNSTAPLIIENTDIEFKNVNFFYDKIQILHDISFKIKAKESIAIVGESGSGKSTIAKLLFGFYHPTTGSITIDDKDIKNYSLKSLRKHISIVPQAPLLFNDTLQKNIQYANMEAPREIVERNIPIIIKAVKLIEVSQNLHEGKIGEKGGLLSGGQKQRISLARALFKKSDILILDEATSALDFKNKNKILHNVNTLFRGKKTIIHITHDLQSLKDNVDKIYVLEKGKIIEEGSYEELLEKNGAFANYITIEKTKSTQIEILEDLTPEDLELLEKPVEIQQQDSSVNDLVKFGVFKQNNLSINVEETTSLLPKDKESLPHAKKSACQIL